MGIDFGVIWAADFDNAIRFHVRRPARRLRVTRRPPSHQNSKDMTDISLWVSILGLFRPLISIMLLDFMSADLPAGFRSTAARRHNKILKLWVSILGLFGPLVSIMPLDLISAYQPTVKGSSLLILRLFRPRCCCCFITVPAWPIITLK